jgi:signal transduction histidine kinase
MSGTTITAGDLAAIESRIVTDARQALADAKAALAAIDRAADKPMAAAALALTGRIQGLLDEHDEAVVLLNEAAALYRELDDAAGFARAVLGLGTADIRRGRIAEALDRFEEAHALAQQTGDRIMSVRALNNMASVYGTFRDHDEAIRLYERAVIEARAIGTMGEMVVPCCNLAQLHIIKVWESEAGTDVEPDIEAAWAAAAEAEAGLTEQTPNPYRMAVLAIRAQCQNLRGQSAAAIETSRKLLAEAGALDLLSMSAGGERELASAYIALGRHDEAAAAAQRSIELFTRIKFVHETTFPLRHLAIAEERRGNLAAALDAERRYHDVRRRVIKDAAERHSNFVKARVALEKAQSEAAMHRRHAEALETVNAELMAAKAAAEAARDAKGAFLSMMGHELRSPLQAILGFSSLIAARTYGDEAIGRYVEAAGDIHGAGQHLLKLINQILDYSKAEVGKLQLEEETVQLSQVVKSALRLLGDQATRSGVRLKSGLDRDFYVTADELKLTQCVLNTLANAVKFTPAGGEVVLSTGVEAGWIVLRIRDTGVGIAPEDIPKVFEPFGQGRNAAGRQGTGLGVPLSKMLMELHGGTLAIESRVGVGTTVTLSLPLDRLVELDPPASPERPDLAEPLPRLH